MNTNELIREIHQKIDSKLTLKDIDLVVNTMISVVSDRLRKGEEVQLSDFGTFAQTKFAVKPAEVFLRQKKG
jgi:nucleoid DNA-binding protein